MRLKNELRDTTELVAGGGVTAVLTFAYIFAVGRALGPAYYADFTAALSVFNLASVALSPLMPTTARLVARYSLRGEDSRVEALRHSLHRRLALGMLLAAAPLLVAIVPLARFLHLQSPVTLLLAFASSALFTTVSVERGVLQGLGRFRGHLANTLLEAALRLAIALILFSMIPSAIAALAAYLAALFVANLLVRRRSVAGGAGKTSVEWGEVRRLASPMFVLMAGAAIYQNADVLAAKHWFPAVIAGQYGAASGLTRSIGILFVPLYIVSGPLLISLHEARQSIVGATLRFAIYFVGLAVIPLALLTLYGRQITTFLFGPSFSDAGVMAGPLAGAQAIGYLALLLAQARVTVGASGIARVYVAFAIVQIGAFVVFHYSIPVIIAAQYVVQGALLLFVTAALFRPIE